MSAPTANGRPDTRRKPEPLSDLQAARVVVQAARDRQEPGRETVGRLPHEWVDALLLAVDEGEPGLETWLGAVRTQYRADPPRYDAIKSALDAARAGLAVVEGADDGTPTVAVPPGPPPFRLTPLGASDFMRAEYPMQWLIKRVLVADQPGVIAAPKKNLKTSITGDMVVSLASGTPMLGHFDVPAPLPVLMLSGESGGFTLQKLVRRICEAKGIAPESMEGRFFIDFALPHLGNQDHLDELGRVIEELNIKVVVIDPLYLCLSSGEFGRRLDPSNLFDMGPLFLNVSRTCLSRGATPLLVHHFRRTGIDPYETPEMDHMAYAGIQEFARQWLLLGRRAKYDSSTGLHELWLSIGASVGFGSDWALDIDEGVMDEDFAGRRWGVSIRPANEARDDAKEQRKVEAEARAEAKAREAATRAEQTLLANVGKVVEAIRRLAERGEPATATQIYAMAALNPAGGKIALARAVADGRVEPDTQPAPAGRKGPRELSVYRVVPDRRGAR